MDAQNGTTRGGVALVTGGSRGLGKDVVLSVAGRGTDVIFTYLSNKADADALVAEVEAMGRRAAALRLDVGDAVTFEAFAEQVRGLLRGWGTDRFQFLVNNAGIGVYASIAETTEAQFDQLMNIHVKGPFFLTQRLLPLLADGGRIVNVSTGLALCYPWVRGVRVCQGRGRGDDEVPRAGARPARYCRQRDRAGSDRDRLRGWRGAR